MLSSIVNFVRADGGTTVVYFVEKELEEPVLTAVCMAVGDFDDLLAEDGGEDMFVATVLLVAGREDATEPNVRALCAREVEEVLFIPCCRLGFSGDDGGVGTSTTRETRCSAAWSALSSFCAPGVNKGGGGVGSWLRERLDDGPD